MKVKKFALFIFAFAFTLISFVGVLTVSKTNGYADTQNSTLTEMFMPASRLEFYDLNSPQAICYQDGYLIISEYHKDEFGNETNKLIVYNPTKNTYEVNLAPTLVNVTCVAKYENYLLLLIDSAIFTLKLDDISGTPYDTGIRVGKSFSVNKNAVVTNTSSGIYKYNMVDDGTKLTFNKIDENFVTGVLSCLLTDSGDFYYFVSGTGLVRRRPDGGETIIYKSVPEVDIAPSYMAELNNYVYFTAPSGLYKVKKEENAELIKVVPVAENGGLGSLKSPAGITVKDGKLLIADTSLNCIQEISPETDAFTEFAVTTESTADYRLTNNANNLSVSDNYLYALDNATISDGETEPNKRLVKISLNSNVKTYEKVDLTALYNDFPTATDIKYASSDTHVVIAVNDKVVVYKQVSGKPITLEKVCEFDKRATALYYLDNDFYFANYYVDVYNANASYVQIYKITMPTQDNELTTPTLSTITLNESGLDFSKAVVGYPIDMTVDIFGNVYVVTANDLQNPTAYKLHRYYSGATLSSNEFTYKPLGVETDFAGNVYLLTENRVLNKFTLSNTVTVENYLVNAYDGFKIKDIALNYRSDKAYFLSDACILTTVDNNLSIQNLSRVCADSVNATTIQTTQQFITVDKNAKLFKVTIGDYAVENGKNYFKTILPISNPNTERIYLIIADIDDDYYLISYSNKFTALVKKSSVQINSSTSIVPTENYQVLGIQSEELQSEEFYLSNTVNYFSRPIFDENYKIGEITANTVVKTTKKVTFNGKTFILVSNESGDVLGYVPEGYLLKTIPTKTETVSTEHETVYGNGEKRAKNVLMVLLIAITLTAGALLLEHKLLFKKPE